MEPGLKKEIERWAEGEGKREREKKTNVKCFQMFSSELIFFMCTLVENDMHFPLTFTHNFRFIFLSVDFLDHE